MIYFIDILKLYWYSCLVNLRQLRVRIDCIDSYQAPEQGAILPVVRIYGRDGHGNACVVHVHGVFPYFYVPVPPGIDAFNYAQLLHNAIDEKLGQVWRRADARFVWKAQVCKAFPFYGFCVGWHPFVKIELRNPNYIYKCADLCRSGQITGEPVQSYESHIPYLLGFLADHNLYGCDYAIFDKFMYKTDRQAYQGLEVDVDSQNITNKYSLSSSQRHDILREKWMPNAGIPSLKGILLQDIEWRRQNGIAEYKFPRLEKLRQPALTWENLAEHLYQWRRRVSDNKNKQLRLYDLSSDVPAAFDLVPGRNNGSSRPISVTGSAQPAQPAQPAQRVPTALSLTPGSQKSQDSDFKTPSYDLGQFYGNIYQPAAPMRSTVVRTPAILPEKKVFFSNNNDIPATPISYGMREFWSRSETSFLHPKLFGRQFEYAKPAPLRSDIMGWHQTNSSEEPQISAPYIVSSLESRKDSDMDELSLFCALTLVGIENDCIRAVFWSHAEKSGTISGDTEMDILLQLIQVVRLENPDCLCAWDEETWMHIHTRGELHDLDIFAELGRVKVTLATIEPRVPGRHLLAFEIILRREIALRQYSLEHVALHILHITVPKLSSETLNKWWDVDQGTVSRYYLRRVSLILQLAAHFEVISRHCAQARVIGIDFYSSLTRGSQFMVESVLSRLAKRENYLLPSPSKAQVGQQNALEYIPLVMEPLSELYTDPVCVLDFRSLYPSIVIAYNLCYSTCLGRTQLWRDKFNKLGFTQDFQLQEGLLDALGEDDIFIAPNGIAYVRPHVRRSLLAQMLDDILTNRFMLKDSLKQANSRRDQRNINNQQLALKFIANVTYGYTSASYSGRMPCAELADSIVLIGRETLARCIKDIEGITKWGTTPKVVYGDTDSLFVRLRGVNCTQAFSIGREIADMITQTSPFPMELQLEKVYDRSILLTKKRYVGRAFDTPGGPSRLDAKGIEVIRRDGTPIVQKVERKAIETLFNTLDLSQVKSLLYKEFTKIITGKVALQDFCFAQKVKLGSYVDESRVPGAAVALSAMAKGESAPSYGERVPFVVTVGPPGTRIVDRCVTPYEVLRNPDLMIDAEYYISRHIIPPLERLFNLCGANIREWYESMPRVTRAAQPIMGGVRQYTKKQNCPVCLQRTSDGEICDNCSKDASRSLYLLIARLQSQELRLSRAHAVCGICSGRIGQNACNSLDCPVFLTRESSRAELMSLQSSVNEGLNQLEW